MGGGGSVAVFSFLVIRLESTVGVGKLVGLYLVDELDMGFFSSSLSSSFFLSCLFGQ